MKTSVNYTTKVVTTGLVVLVFFAISTFCGRYLAEMFLVIRMPPEATSVRIEPSGLLPQAVEFDPNAERRSVAWASSNLEAWFGGLGLVDYVTSKSPGGRRSDVVYYEDERSWTYFDRTAEQMVFRRTDAQAKRLVTYYAGPEGISDAPDAGHGCFIDPIITRAWGAYYVYDTGLRRFFSIDLRPPGVRMGPPLEDSPAVQPVSIGSGGRSEGMNLSWQPPMKPVPREQGADDAQQKNYEFILQFGVGDPGGYIPVVDASGRVDLLDSQTLQLVRGKGSLPPPKTLYGQGSSQPSRLFDYGVQLVGVGRDDPDYVGMVTASLSRQGTSMTLTVLDPAGRQVRKAETVCEYGNWRNSPRPMSSATAALFGVPWGPALTIFKYLLENVHPPILSVASFFTANGIEARASHRTLFLLPNSFVAMHRDRINQGIVSQFLGALWTMFPVFLLAVFLTWRVLRDAGLIGLSGNTRAGWTVATLAFGLPAYITYRLTRPKTTLVTCANCGRPRRPDMERCHRCKSPWTVPELVPPAWCVLDGGPAAAPRAADESEKSAAETEQKPDSSVESM